MKRSVLSFGLLLATSWSALARSTSMRDAKRAMMVHRDASDANFNLNNLPKTWQEGQAGTNQCTQSWGESSQEAMCQNAFINDVNDFCLWAPPTPTPIGESERYEVSWCMKSGYGTRLIPQGTIQGAHFVKTSAYVQVTGTGDLTKINVPKGDMGGELDPHGADGNGNPIGGLVFSNAFGQKYKQIHEWMSFMSDSQFCFRACLGKSQNAQNLCQHIYDTMGCNWNIPANYNPGFEDCTGDVAPAPGIYGESTFYQDNGNTPAAYPPPASQCSAIASLEYGAPQASSTSTSSSAPTSTVDPSSSSSMASTTSTSESSSTLTDAKTYVQTSTISIPTTSATDQEASTRVTNGAFSTKHINTLYFCVAAALPFLL